MGVMSLLIIYTYKNFENKVPTLHTNDVTAIHCCYIPTLVNKYSRNYSAIIGNVA